MSISEQTRTQIIRLIYEGESLDPHDLESFYGWMQASYELLGFHPVQQERFDEYCRSSHDSISMRLYVGVWMLKQSLFVADSDANGDIPATLTRYS